MRQENTGTIGDDEAPLSHDPAWERLSPIQLELGGEPLSLDQTLGCGQAFRWRRLGPEHWEGIAGGVAWRLELQAGVLLARMVPVLSESRARGFLRHYFALEIPALNVQMEISRAHAAAAEAVRQFTGLRILHQEPRETVLTFAIATATNVPRVTRSIAETCRRFGAPIAELDGQVYHDFPTTEAILEAPTGELYGPCNLAYRARSIQAVAGGILLRGPGWLEQLANGGYVEAHQSLDTLPFYGPKVSDCACLFGLGFDQAVPVDVHVWAIAHELFGEDIPTKTLTARTYARIGERFRELFGPWAGWAQQYLFCARRAIPIRERFQP